MGKKVSNKALRARAQKARVAELDRHVLVCTASDCGGKPVAKAMRRRVKAEGLKGAVEITEVDCLGICEGGTIVVVHPDGTWYGNVDADLGETIVTRHLRDGRPVRKAVFLVHPLGG